MARVQLMSAMAFDIDKHESTGVADPVIRVLGELPGTAQPFGIHRVYKGSQGTYEEVLVLVDPDGTVIWESAPRYVELRGAMFEDLFRRRVEERIPITSGAEHVLVFYLDGEIAGRIPVFIDAPESVTSAGVLLEAAETALKKGSICWIRIPQPDGSTLSRPAWYVQQGAKLFVVKGETEQRLPNLEHNDVVSVVVKSKEIKATIGELTCDVRVIGDEEEFERIAALGLGTRLNLPDGNAALERWKQHCTVVELTPRG
ncbi:hypothetical protein [Egicoccus halophilus]|uniref:Uncharacterized protein n=1 Tax=Egicoccus halophilus TaxID=1670830 RepID=A0A8J3EVC2_9ACTN|nr:hypothetical protein [Egicoccus halophilus]GGI08831.1 hypothetical protein GCM10011354_31050 [Egicoccus halophilus]